MIDTTTCETFEYALDRVRESMTGQDVLDELWDVRDQIAACLKRGRTDLAGEVVAAVFDAQIHRIAAYGFFAVPIETKTAQEAAAAVMAK